MNICIEHTSGIQKRHKVKRDIHGHTNQNFGNISESPAVFDRQALEDLSIN